MKADPLRGFTEDREDVAEANRLTALQTVNFLELMLEQIAKYCPIIARNALVKNSTSIHTIRQHFGFQITGAHFIDECLLSNPLISELHEALRCRNTLQRGQGICALRNRYARIRNSTGRAHVPRTRGPATRGNRLKIADDLYCGGNTPYELLENWKKVLHALNQCGLRLSDCV